MFEEAMARIAGRFRRVEPRATARAFLLGLLSGIERKNCWQLAEQAGHARPGPMQRLLRSARWDADAVRDDIRAYVFERLGADDGVLIVDETGFLKKGTASAGVQRQYTGTAGRIENSQVGVFLAYASSKGRALIDRRLYMPDTAWCQDTQRRTRAGVPDQTRFATKPTLAGQMVAAALDAGIDASWVTGDEAYGQDPGLRALLESRRIGYVLEDPARRWTVAELAARVGQSRATFAARFTGAVGEPPLTYLTRLADGLGR
jgi:SRSO17 transposase